MQMVIWHKFKELFVRSDAVAVAPRRAGNALSRAAMRSPQDKRMTVRKPQRFAEGFIWSDRMAASKACNIRDLSATGARIDLLNSGIKAHTLSGVLTLYFPTEKREIDCQVAWRAGSSIGLKFMGSYRAPTKRYGARPV
jgi:hypothetical protein